MTIAANLSTPNAPSRSEVGDAWRRADPAGGDQNSSAKHVLCSLDGAFTLDRVFADAVPGEAAGRGDRNEVVETRSRLSLDGNLDIVVDHSRSRRFSPSEDVTPHADAMAQLERLAQRRLRTLASAGVAGLRSRDGSHPLPLASADGRVAADAEVTRKLVRKYGTDDTRRLRQVMALSPEATRTVSRLAAADDLTDLFLHTELVAMTRDFERVEHRRPYFRELFPMRSLNAPGAVAYESQVFDRRGRAEHTVDFRGRAPTVTINREPRLRPLVWSRAGMTWTWLELQRWQQARSNGAPLPDFVREQQDAAREALLELENLDLTFGHKHLKLVGLLTPTLAIGNDPEWQNPIPVAATSANYADLANPLAVQLLLAGAKEIVLTESEAVPEVIALGTRDYLYVTTTPFDAANSNGETIAEVALRMGKSLGVKAIVRMPELGFSQEVKDYLEGLGYDDPYLSLYAGGMVIGGENKAVQVTFSRNPRKLRGIIGQDLMQLPPDRTSTETHVQVIMSTGAFEVLHPKAAHRQPVDDPT